MFEDAIAVHGAELRPVRDEVGTRTMPEVVRFYGHWKRYTKSRRAIVYYAHSLHSSKLGEENARIKAARAAGKKAPAPPASPISDDEGSFVTETPRGGYSCGACRTRESDMWWKAPKGLASAVLCDNCGISWRKYADLNVRPLREEAVSKKTGEKREGTPLANSTNKRARVRDGSICCVALAEFVYCRVTPMRLRYLCRHRHRHLYRNSDAWRVTRTAQLRKSFDAANASSVCIQVKYLVSLFTYMLTFNEGVCGVIPDESTFESWTCDLCANEKNLEASLVCFLISELSSMQY